MRNPITFSKKRDEVLLAASCGTRHRPAAFADRRLEHGGTRSHTTFSAVFRQSPCLQTGGEQLEEHSDKNRTDVTSLGFNGFIEHRAEPPRDGVAKNDDSSGKGGENDGKADDGGGGGDGGGDGPSGGGGGGGDASHGESSTSCEGCKELCGSSDSHQSHVDEKTTAQTAWQTQQEFEALTAQWMKDHKAAVEATGSQLAAALPTGPRTTSPLLGSAFEAPPCLRAPKRVRVEPVETVPMTEYEQQRHKRIRENNEALPLPNFRLPRRHALLPPRAPNLSALPVRRMVVGPGRPEYRPKHCQGYEGSCSARACAQEAVQWAGHTSLAA